MLISAKYDFQSDTSVQLLHQTITKVVAVKHEILCRLKCLRTRSHIFFKIKITVGKKQDKYYFVI